MNIPAQQTPSQPHTTSVNNGWDFFDRIYCISLSSRTDRRVQAAKQFDRVGLTGLVNFLIVEKDTTDSERGIFQSHMKAISAGLAAGAQTILIFEDDVIFDRFSTGILASSVQFMRSNRDWHAFFFGCYVKSSRKTNYSNVLKIRYRSTLHAYVLNRPFAEMIVAHPWAVPVIDDALRDLNDGHMYAAYPAFAFQSDSCSDNQKQLRLDRFRRCMGGMQRLQKWNEFSSLHLRALIAIHAVILLLLLLVILRWK